MTRFLMVALAVLLIGCAVLPLRDSPSRCTLDWSTSMDLYTGWRWLDGKWFDMDGDGKPEWGVDLIAPRDDSVRLIVVFRADTHPLHVGPLVYCGVYSPEGKLLEEIGTNPFRKVPVNPS